MNELSRPLADRLSKLPPPEKFYEGIPESEATIVGAVQALEDGKTKYTNRPGIVPLREWIANHVNETYHFNLTADDVTVTCGITEAEYVTLRYFTEQRPGKIITADHTDDEIYVDHIQPVANLLGTDVISYDMNLQKYMASLMKGERDPQPEHFDPPTDEIAVAYIGEDGAKSTALLQYAQANNIPVVWSISMDINDIGVSQMPELLPNTVILGGFETYLNGWRVGWMAGHAQHSKLRSYKQSMTICTPSVSQWAALAMLEAQS